MGAFHEQLHLPDVCVCVCVCGYKVLFWKAAIAIFSDLFLEDLLGCVVSHGLVSHLLLCRPG